MVPSSQMHFRRRQCLGRDVRNSTEFTKIPILGYVIAFDPFYTTIAEQ